MAEVWPIVDPVMASEALVSRALIKFTYPIRVRANPTAWSSFTNS